MRYLFLVLLLILLAMPITFAKVAEIKTTCGLLDCESYFIIDQDLTAMKGMKASITAVDSKSTSNETMKYDYGDFLVEQGKLNNVVIEIIDKETIKISGKINGATQNLWGFSILGDDSHLHSTWWNSTWMNKKQLYFTDAYGITRPDEVVTFNLTTEEAIYNTSNSIKFIDVRITTNVTGTEVEVPSAVVNGTVAFSGTDSTNNWYVIFVANTANTYFIYYNNSGASAPTYSGITLSSGLSFAGDCQYLINNGKLTWHLCNGTGTSARNGIRNLTYITQGLNIAGIGWDEMFAFNGTNTYDDKFDVNLIYNNSVVMVLETNYTLGGLMVKQKFTFYFNTTRWDVYVQSTGWDGDDCWVHQTIPANTFNLLQSSTNATPQSGSLIGNMTYGVLINSTNNMVAGFAIEPQYTSQRFTIQLTNWGYCNAYSTQPSLGKNHIIKEVYESNTGTAINSGKKLYYPIITSTGTEIWNNTNMLTISNVYDESTLASLSNYNITIIFTNRSYTYSSNSASWSIPISTLGNGDAIVRISIAGYNYRDYRVTLSTTVSTYITAYLSSSSTAIPFLIYSSTTETPLQGVYITIEKSIGETMTLMTDSYTDISGTSLFYLDTSTLYHFTLSKTSFGTVEFDLMPILTSGYKFYMNSTISIAFNKTWEGITWWFLPEGSTLNTYDIYKFKFHVGSYRNDLTWLSINLTNNSMQTQCFNISYYPTGTNSLTLNCTLNMTGFRGNLTILGQFSKVGFDTQSLNKTYYIYNETIGNFTWSKMFEVIKSENYGVSKLTGSIMAIFGIMLLLSSLGLAFVGVRGGSILAFALLAILPFMGVISWTFYIFIGMLVVAALLLRERI